MLAVSARRKGVEILNRAGVWVAECLADPYTRHRSLHFGSRGGLLQRAGLIELPVLIEPGEPAGQRLGGWQGFWLP